MEKLKICLADDDQDDRDIFSQAFSELDSMNDLMTFKNGLEVLDYLDTTEELPDIIFLDLNMPILGGLETLSRIRENERYKMLSIAIYSTSSMEKDIENTLIAGANVYITKPTNFKTLKDTILKVMKVNRQFIASGLDRETFIFVA